METFKNIQAIRTAAALFVVWAHVREMFPKAGFANIPSGLAGVDLFFVVSGFIMVVSTMSGSKSALTFFIDRLTRVAPLYYIATLAVFILTLSAPSLLKSSTADVPSLLASLSFVPISKTDLRVYPMYYLGWTLNYEMFFYLVFALGISLGGKAKVVFTTFVIGLLVAVGALIPDLYSKSVIVYALTRPIMIDFVFGMIIALMVGPIGTLANRHKLLPVLTLVLGIIGIIFAGHMFVPATDGIAPATDTVFRYGIWAAVIVASAVALEATGRTVKNKLILAIGAASYSLYLFHFFIVAAVIAFANHFSLTTYQRIPLAIMTYAVCVSAAIIIYEFLEKPITRYFRTLRADKKLA